MNKIRLEDKEFQVYIHYETIYQSIQQIASKINRDFKGEDTPVFLSVLNGAFMFTGDLFKELRINSYLSFVKMASYQGMNSSGEVRELIGLNEDLADRHVIVLEDIVDSGLTIRKLYEQIQAHQPRSISIATLLLKPDVYGESVELDYVGMEISNDFIIGYGLDYNGLGRNLKDIYQVVDNGGR